MHSESTPLKIEVQRPFRGDPALAFAEAFRVLAALSFRIESKNARKLCATGPGMLSSRQPPLNFSKRLEVEVLPGHMFVRADQAALDRLLRILLWTPFGIAVIVLGILLTIFALKGVTIPWLTVVLPCAAGPLLISLIQIPIFRRVFGKRARQAIADLTDHLVDTGERQAR